MDNKPLGPPLPEPETSGTTSMPDSKDAIASLRSTEVVSSTSSPDADRAGRPAAAVPVRITTPGRPAQRAPQLGDYVLLKKVGSGAMGVVYKAHQLSTMRSVALKVLFKHIADNPRLVERFHREARVAGNLEHPNLVRGYEVGEDQGLHYFAMEYCPGNSLQKWVAHVGKLSLGDSVHIAIRCARALQHAHANGCIHRDIKPDNILITRKGEVKVADLGMVKQLDEEMELTQTGHAVGTPWYMPLEQAKNAKESDGRCDIYALGCVFYACLTGQPPFCGKSLVDIIYAKEVGTFPPARQSNDEVPESVDLILLKMTAKLPKHRYQTCAELITDLESLELANPTLTFVEAAKAQAAKLTAAAEASAAVPASAKTPMPKKPPSPANDVWYVRYKRPDGQQVVQKMTTAKVLRLLESPDFNSGAMASRQPRGGFRTLATYKEFEKLARGRSTRSGPDKHAVGMRKLYEQIVEEESQRKKPAAQPVTAQRSWTGTLLRILVISVIVGAVLLGAAVLVRTLSAVFG
jgi:serine/threonine-protein kinase